MHSGSDFTLTREQVGDLVALSGELDKEAERCAEANCWRAALVLLSSSVEAALLATACYLEPKLRARKLWPGGDPTAWGLHRLASLANRAGWLPSVLSDATDEDLFASLAGEVGDAVAFVRSVRNMAAHPGAYVRESMRPDFDDVEHMRPTYEIFNGIANKVFERLTEQVNISAPTSRDRD